MDKYHAHYRPLCKHDFYRYQASGRASETASEPAKEKVKEKVWARMTKWGLQTMAHKAVGAFRLVRPCGPPGGAIQTVRISYRFVL